MKTVLLALGLSFFVSGCGIIPKPVEFFQRKVRHFPEQSASYSESERQAAALAADRAREAEKIAIQDGSAAEIPARDAAELNEALSRSLGPPKSPWEKEIFALVERLDRQNAMLRQDIEKFKRQNEELAGKKVEGTGLFQVPYLVWVGILAGIVLLLYVGLRFVLQIVAMSNPPVAVGLKAAQLGGRALSQALSQVIRGGEAFKEAVLKSERPLSGEEIKELFRQHHLMAQSPDTQEVIRGLTR